MSKKLIAVAAAAALALTALVGVAPASATATAVLDATGFVASTGANDGSTADKAATINVPATNILTEAGDFAGKIDIGATAGDSITVTTTGAVKAIRDLTGLTAASENWNVATLGKASHSYAAAGSAADDIFVYTTSTTAGSVEVKVTSSTYSLTKTFYVKGVAGLGHAIKVTAPDTIAKLAKGVVVVTVTDIFGNAVENAAADAAAAGKISFTVDRFPSASASVPASLVYNSTSKDYRGEITSASNGAFTIQVTMVGGGSFAAIPNIDGIGDADAVKILNVNSPAAATANAAATAQIAALTAQLANSRGKDVSVTKKKFNALAKRWNSAFPGQKVALKQ